MKLIKELEGMIEDEIEGVEHYAKMAVHYREEYPVLADVLYRISQQEASHVELLHEQVAAVIEKYRKEKGTPPAAMMAVYEYLHDRHIDKMKQAKLVQAMYK